MCNEWIMIRNNYPKEIKDFINEVFEIFEIRGRVGIEDGIKFYIHTNEQNHTIPHVHAQYGKHNISININTGDVLVGNLPNKNKQKAVDWVVNNKEKLLREWQNIAISAISHLTKSNLD